MRPRMYGSSDSHRFLTSTSPGPGVGTSVSTILKFDSSTGPLGRLASSTCMFLAIIPPESIGRPFYRSTTGLKHFGLLCVLQVEKMLLQLNQFFDRQRAENVIGQMQMRVGLPSEVTDRSESVSLQCSCARLLFACVRYGLRLKQRRFAHAHGDEGQFIRTYKRD